MGDQSHSLTDYCEGGSTTRGIVACSGEASVTIAYCNGRRPMGIYTHSSPGPGSGPETTDSSRTITGSDSSTVLGPLHAAWYLLCYVFFSFLFVLVWQKCCDVCTLIYYSMCDEYD